MATAKKYIVPIEVTVTAASASKAEEEVTELMRYALEVSNDTGIFENFRLHETSDTIEQAE